jgi:riboflavin biosynthesis pyrimidine reductase
MALSDLTEELLAAYAPPTSPARPRHVRAGMAMSADGAIARDGRSRALSTPIDQAVFRVLRAHADVVLVGAGTVRDEGYGPVDLEPGLQEWRTAQGRPPNPPLAIVTRSGDVPDKARPGAILVTGDLRAVLDDLADRGLTRVLCEGGPGLLGDLLLAGVLDQLCCTLSPRLLGGGTATVRGLVGRELPTAYDLELAGLVERDGTLLLRWNVSGVKDLGH